ncbi:hypothetical protein DV735_g4820, partial [Chaetothyriales sp. CBS 134920]
MEALTLSNPVEVLERLRDLINTSIDTIKEGAILHRDPTLSLSAVEPHPIHNRQDEKTVKALKCVSASAQMLKAICDPTTFLNDIIYGVGRLHPEQPKVVLLCTHSDQCHDGTALFVACQADVANHLNNGPLKAEELSAKTGIEKDKLERYLRNLCNSHIFEEVGPSIFANNQLSITFKAETKRALVAHCADEARASSCKAWDALVTPGFKGSTAPNKAPFNIAYNTELDIFQYVSKVRPDIGARAKVAMAGKGLNLGQYLSLYPWAVERGATIIDVGGGVGGATLPVLQAHPSLKLVIQDLPDTEPRFLENLETNYPDVQKSRRASFLGHDFFTPQPRKHESLFFLRHVIHDWPDEEAVAILRNLAQAMTHASKLLICEHLVLPTYRERPHEAEADGFAAPPPLLANWGAAPTSRLDLQVLACLNAKQRTTAEFANLVSRAGLKVVKLWHNFGDEAIIQCSLARELSNQGLSISPTDPYLVKNGSIKELVIFSPSQTREFFAADGKDHEKKSDCNFGHYFYRTLGQCVGVQNGPTWHTSRQYLEPHFSFSAATARLHAYRDQFEKWIARLPEDPEAGGEKTGVGFCIDSEVACRQLPFRLIAMALYGDMLTDSLFGQLWDLNTAHEHIVHSAFLSKWPQSWFYHWLPTRSNRVLRQYDKDWKDLNLSIIAEAKQAKKKNIVCAAVDIYEAVENGDMNLTMYLQSLDEILFTNIDVTSTMFASALINLGRHGSFQDELREEILANSDSNDSCAAYMRREDSLLHKTYLEVLRIRFSLPEVTAVEKRIGGFLIPAGTSVITDIHRLNKLSPRFDSLSRTQIRYSLHGYGIGPRKCLGKNFANLIIKLLILATLREYRVVVDGTLTNIRRDRFTCL